MVGAVSHLPCFKDLIAVLFECFLIISLGYLSCRFKLITNQAKDLNSYLTTFALPMIIFLNIAQMEFHTINLSFLFCMLTAKLLVFISVTILTTTISYPTNFGYAGSLSILATQSNDFALGYPLIKSLYGDAKPEMLNYLSLMAPIQLLILNPLGIVMLEYNKSKQSTVEDHGNDGEEQHRPITNDGTCQYCKTVNIAKASAKPTNLDNQNQSTPKRQFHHSLKPATQNPSQATSDSIISNNSNCTLNRQRLRRIPRERIRSNHDDSVSERNSTIKPPIQLTSSGFKQKNVKSLVVTIPARIDIIESDSEESTHTLNESSPQAQTSNNNSNVLSHSINRLSNISDQRIYEQNSPLVDLVENSNFRSNSPSDIMPYCCSCPANNNVTPRNSEPKINLNFLVALATNPLIIASVVALMVNLINGPELPKFVTRVSNTIAASFASPALFVVGLSMYGKFELLLRNPGDLLLSSVLVLTKVLLLPSLMRTLALIILPRYTPPEELTYLIDFSFLYGLLPTAPTACIIAKQYGVLSNVVSISMLLSTFISAPLMLGSAVIINPSSVINVIVLENIISQTMRISSVLTFFLTFLTLYGFWKAKMDMSYTTFTNISESVSARINKFKANPMHIFLFLLAVSQIMVGFGGITWYFINSSPIDDGDRSQAHSSLHSLENMADENLTTLPIETDSSVILTSVPLIDSSDPEPSPLLEPVESWVVPISFNFCLKTLFKMQYVLSSFGLIMSRFAIMCIILSMAASRFIDPLRASKLSSFLVKAYLVFGTTSVIWLIFDSERLRHLPVEPSLPTQSISLYFRLLYNLIVLIVSVPMFSLSIRFDNKKKKESQALSVPGDSPESTDNEVGPSFTKRRFVTSSASLSSDTSSALTTNTNLELIIGQNAVPVPDPSINQQQQQQQPCCDAISVVLDGGPYEIRRPASPTEGQTIVNQATLFGSYGSTGTDIRANNIDEHQTGHHYEVEEPTINGANLPHKSTRLGMKEFDKYSILIVFMLIDSMLNLSSIAQKLLQDHSFGTFKQIEVLNVAMEFGQGFLTFLIYGTKGQL